MHVRIAVHLVPFLLAACASAPPPAFKPVTTAGQFIETVAGKPITFANGNVLVANPDGTLGGNVGSTAPGGRWRFANGQLCRSMTLGGVAQPEVCNLLEVMGDRLRLLNPDGTLSADASLG